MRVKIDRGRKYIQLDTTGGALGPVTSAGHMGVAIASRDAFDGWRVDFYPEADGRTFDGGVEFDRGNWPTPADRIVELMAEPRRCGECKREL